jgi:catechol 2,3-dioxygenase-like lactoylglutathione lyase family enzyme
MTPSRIRRITRITLNVCDLQGVSDFYVDALGFTREITQSTRVRLTLGGQEIELVEAANAVPYPAPRAANDPWFQHFAIAVSDMRAAYARLARFAPEPITQGGPQLLPPSTGSVTAYKFRDPEGHPLELSHAPGSHWSRAGESGALCLGIDHTALATSDLEASRAFYIGLGFSEGPGSLNQGPEQARLDGLEGATVDIVTLFSPDAGPHIELLHYRSPPPSPPRAVGHGDIAATRTTLELFSGAAPEVAAPVPCRADPDGHLLQFTA